MAKTYVKTDKNGTKIYYDYTCDRCGGTGGAEAWKFTGFTCYKCGGSGKMDTPDITKEYTPVYAAKLKVAADKRAEKRRAEVLIVNVAEQATFLADRGFNELGHTFIVLGNTYDIKDSIREAGGKYSNVIGWHFTEAVKGFNTAMITKDECLEQTEAGYLTWKDTDIIRALLRSKQLVEATVDSNFVGKVGDKLNLDLTLKKSFNFESTFGTQYIHKFVDTDGNIFVWKTSNSLYEIKELDTCSMLGTVKEHSEYNGEKQTVMTRCKVLKGCIK